MLDHNDEFTKPLCPGCLDVIHSQDLQHARSCDARKRSHLESSQGERGQDDVCDVPIAIPGDGEETKIDTHGHDQHDPQPEARDRLTEKIEGHANQIKDAVPLDGGEDANRDGKDESPKQRKEDEATRCRYPLENETEGWLFIPDRFPEIALEGSFQKEKILDWDGPIQTEFFPDDCAICIRSIRADHDAHRISREARDDKNRHGNANKDDNRMKESPGQVTGHRNKKKEGGLEPPPLPF